MRQSTLLLIATLLSISSYCQRVAENLVQELYYVDGENYRVISYDRENMTAVEIKLKTSNIPTEDNGSYVTFSYSKGNERGSTRFECEIVENTVHNINPIAYFSAASNILKIAELDSTENIRKAQLSYYRLESTIDTFFLYKLLEYPKKTIRKMDSVFRKEVEVRGDTTYYRSYSNDWLSSQSFIVKISDDVSKEYFKWMTGKKAKKESYSLVRTIIQQGDSTITYTDYDVANLSKQTKLYKHEKKVEIKDKSGNLLFSGRYRRKKTGKKAYDHVLVQEIEYQYFGKKLERQKIKTPEGSHLIEIRRKYAE